MIRGYPERPSVAPGDRLVLRIATDAPRFDVAFHRWGDGFALVEEKRSLPGAPGLEHATDLDWGWPDYAFDIPRDWPSGVYVAHLREPASPPLDVWMDRAAALFVVRGAGRAPLLYKVPLATYHAYNVTGGGCLYVNPPWSTDPPGGKVSWRRPGGGIGGETHGAPDVYAPASPRQTFAHWDAPFIRWLIRSGYGPEFCTDLDVHDAPSLLGGHRLLLSVGHDEYWTDAMRDAVEAFAANGGNVAFFGANVCWWRIHFVDDRGAMVCHQGGPRGARDHWWPPTGAARPEDGMSGVSYRHGGGWWDGPRDPTPFVVQDGAHWIFAGTGLATGDRFGGAASPPAVGYECDGAPLAAIDEKGHATLDGRARLCGTPRDLHLLAVARLRGAWQELPHREIAAAGEGVHNAAMALHSPGGTIFTAGTTDWALALGRDPRIDRITRNVLTGLLRG